MHLLLVAVYFVFPALVLTLRKHVRGLRFLNPVVTCYVVGILVGNLGVLGESELAVMDALATVTVPLSIPLMLFSIDLARWKNLAGKAGLSMLGAALAVTIATLVGHLLFRGTLPDTWKLSGLLIGVYTGGTPNMAAIRTALRVEAELYLAVHTADIAVSAVYFLFVMTAAQKVIGFVLRPYGESKNGATTARKFRSDRFDRLLRPENRLPLLGALGLSLLIFAIAGGVSLLLPDNLGPMVAILVITTLALLATLIEPVRGIPYSFQLGEYLIFVFCLAVGSMADIGRILGAAPQVLAYVALAVFGSFALHILYCRLLSIDVDTMLITSTSAIMSPPFVGITAVALKNREIIVAGITTGLMGYAVGNYLGIVVAQLYRILG